MKLYTFIICILFTSVVFANSLLYEREFQIGFNLTLHMQEDGSFYVTRPAIEENKPPRRVNNLCDASIEDQESLLQNIYKPLNLDPNNEYADLNSMVNYQIAFKARLKEMLRRESTEVYDLEVALDFLNDVDSQYGITRLIPFNIQENLQSYLLEESEHPLALDYQNNFSRSTEYRLNQENIMTEWLLEKKLTPLSIPGINFVDSATNFLINGRTTDSSTSKNLEAVFAHYAQYQNLYRKVYGENPPKTKEDNFINSLLAFLEGTDRDPFTDSANVTCGYKRTLDIQQLFDEYNYYKYKYENSRREQLEANLFQTCNSNDESGYIQRTILQVRDSIKVLEKSTPKSRRIHGYGGQEKVTDSELCYLSGVVALYRQNGRVEIDGGKLRLYQKLEDDKSKSLATEDLLEVMSDGSAVIIKGGAIK